MNKLITVVIAIAMGLSGLPAYGDTDAKRQFDPSMHVRVEYNQFNTPDSTIFIDLLDEIRTYTETHSKAELENWVFSQMNATFSQKLGAWVTSRAASLRHTRKDISDLVILLRDEANRSHETTMSAQRGLFCSSKKKLGFEKKLAALEKRNLDKHVDADFYLNDTMDQIGEVASADLRAWLGRIKKGFSSREYNYRTLWAGRESELDAQFSQFCNAIIDLQ